MKRFATVVVAAAVAAAVGAGVAGGQGAPAGTLVVVEQAQGGNFAVVDNPPKAKRTRAGVPRRLSVGDMEAFSTRVADQQGNPMGTVHVQCVVTVPGRERTAQAVCTGVFALRDGTISVAAVLTGQQETIAASVTGGTGAYSGARGTLTSSSQQSGGDVDTFQFMP